MESKSAFKNSGFTLIELLVSILVVSILVGLGYANFRAYSQRQSLWAVARQIEGDLKLAQSYATSGKEASSCPSGSYFYGYSFAKDSSTSYIISLVCFGVGHYSYPISISRSVPIGFEIYNNFSPIIFRSVSGRIDSSSVINIRRVNTTTPFITISVSMNGIVNLTYNN